MTMTFKNVRLYTKDCWTMRFFLLNLAFSDIRNKYRKSFLGILWTILNPILLTAMLAIVMSKVFNQDSDIYSLYVLAGIIGWDYLVQCGNAGAQCFIISESYIKQCKRPLLIYVIRIAISNLPSLALGVMSLSILATILNHSEINFSLLSMLLAIFIVFFTVIPLAGLLGFITTKFRDFTQITLLMFQLAWFISPVFIHVSAFESSPQLNSFMNLNPIYHYLQLFREPIIYGNWPELRNFLISSIPSMLLWPLFVWRLREAERKLVYYI